MTVLSSKCDLNLIYAILESVTVAPLTEIGLQVYEKLAHCLVNAEIVRPLGNQHWSGNFPVGGLEKSSEIQFLFTQLQQCQYLKINCIILTTV